MSMTSPTANKPHTLMLIFATLMVSIGYFYTVTDRCWRGMMDCFDNVNPLTAPAPFRYRILAPIIEQALAPYSEPYRAFIADAIFHAFLVALLLPGLYVWLKRFMDESRALTGVFILCLGFMLSFQLYMPFGTTIVELVLLVFALNVIDKSLPLYVILLALAALNRETSVVLVALYAVWHGRIGWRQTLLLFVVWAAITLGLHMTLGAAPHIYGFQNTLERNLGSLAQAVLYNAPFVVLWVLVIRQYPTAQHILKRFAWIALVYAGAVIVGALWIEVRVLLPLFPLVLPIILR